MTKALPSGVVTLLFTDIEGSTRLLRELGDDYAGALADHRRRIREACAAHGGVPESERGRGPVGPDDSSDRAIAGPRRPIGP